MLRLRGLSYSVAFSRVTRLPLPAAVTKLPVEVEIFSLFPPGMRAAKDPNDWMHDFYGTTRGEDYVVPDTPPSTPDKDLVQAIQEGARDALQRIAPATTKTTTTNPPYLASSDRRRFVGHAPAAISIAHRQQYSQAQQALYRDAGKDTGGAAGLTVLAKAAGKRSSTTTTTTTTKKKKARKPAGVSERWVTTKNGRVLKLKPKTKKHGRTALSRSWPTTRDPSSSSSNSFYREDYSDRQAERAEMERGDRK